ncbi:hypothetical protein GQX73_g10289 [Xylaria multiplex]|uniref:Aminoglycoside phosphotransferase domain-containing protein n=1 Tax=Xylaria multiplex TaxID=323545 RepID=A0A7C8MK24_9PEZI|nr:hypothetical protein GQX73_g10289 [Xylaria multiplex]
MPHIIYTLENAIDSFFLEAGASSSRMECDEVARQRCGGEIRPVDIRGSTSYTVIAGQSGNKIIQFREKTALLDMRMLALAKDIYGDVVASCSELGWVGNQNGSQLAIYKMDRLPGENYITARPSFTRDQRLNTVYSLASLVDRSAISTECYARFEYLAGVLPERFLSAVTEVQAALPALLDGSYPMALTHSDLNEMNILVDVRSGNITGVVDWTDASMQPFGFTLYALENALGSMGPNGWKWFDNVDELRAAFWSSFREQTGVYEPQTKLIKLAGKAGILIRYGTAYDREFPGMIGVRDPNTEDFRYLDALIVTTP